MLILHEKANEEMIADALSAFPDECCGFLFGEEEGDERIITVIQPVDNAKQGDKRRRFEISSIDYLRAERFAEANALRLLGIYHSHPNHPAVPSEHDRAAAQPYFSYVIVSVMNELYAGTRSWLLNDQQQFEEETIDDYQLIKNQTMATVLIPTPLRKFTNNSAKLQIAATNVQEIVADLSLNFPDLKKHLLDENGRLRSFINIFVGEEDIRNLQQEQTLLQDETVVSIIPAIAGGVGDSSFTKEELARYNRHIIIPEFGLESQKKLKEAKVLVIGSGGLGSPVLLYLAAAGVGTIGIVDFDVVDDSNLQRQVLFGVDSIGIPKVIAAKRRIRELNPHITVNIFNIQLNAKNALDIIRDYDVIADGTDNFPTRYLVNDASILLDKPNVYASIFQFEGQVSVFNHKNEKGERGPNYRDLYPTPPPPGLVPSCAEGGVLGVLPGIIGSLQALEVIKVITGVGETLSGRFFTFDALTFSSRTFNIKRNANTPEITALIDYEQFCGIKTAERPIKEISAKELYDLQVRGEQFQLIDVREPHEYDIVNIGAELIPLANISSNADAVSRDKKVIVHCKMGGRSAKAIRELEDQFGFDNLYNLKGGILAYIDEVKPELTKY